MNNKIIKKYFWKIACMVLSEWKVVGSAFAVLFLFVYYCETYGVN